MRTKTAIITTVSVLMCGLFALSACNSKTNYNWSLADLGSDVDVHTAAQKEFLSEDNYLYAGIKDKNGNPTANGETELSHPDPIHLTWEATPAKTSDITVEYYVVEISTNKNFAGEVASYGVETNELDIYNLYIATNYYWRVSAKLSNGKTTAVSPVSTFTTADAAPRNIFVEGVTNIRDLGGWKTSDGDRVRQGMIYRCGRLNKSEQPNVEIEITEQGISTMRNILGIKTQIDLRNPDKYETETGGITSSPLGDDVTYLDYAIEWDVGSKNILTYENNHESIRNFFEYLSDESHYPVIYHCNIGTDRTGMLAFLINGYLGVPEEDLYRDYLFSNFGLICYKPTDSPRTYAKLTASGNYVDTIKKYPGSTLSKKIEGYLVNEVKVPKANLEAIKEILMV